MRPSSDHLERPDCPLCGREDADPFLAVPVQLSPATGETFHFVRCPACRLVFLGPRPPESEAHRYYPPGYLPHRGPVAWGRWAPVVGWAERRLDRRRVRWVTRARPLGPGAEALDVGCGRPTFLRELYRRTGASCTGVDTSDAGWRTDPRGFQGVRLLQGALPEAEGALRRIAPGGFHLLTLWHVLEHAHDPLALLRALRRLAAPGAVLVVEVPDLDSLTARLQGSRWAGFDTPRHTAAYTGETLAATLSTAGWIVTRSLRHGTFDPWVLWWLGRRIARGDAPDGPLERHFAGFVAGKAATLPLVALQRWLPLGIQTAFAEPLG